MKVYAILLVLLTTTSAHAQKQVELFNLVQSLVPDSSEYSAVGDWAVGKPSTYAVKWESDRVTMSDDININFFRKGIAHIAIKGSPIVVAGKSVPWNVMIKGPRAGFSSFTISGTAHKSFSSKTTIDSLFLKNTFTAKLLQRCNKSAAAGFYFYELRIPGKEVAFLKISYRCSGDACSLRLDGYDDWSRKDAVLTCP